LGRLLLHAVEKPRTCSYLPGQSASLEYKYLVDVGPAELEAMLARGWRRFGLSYFRPACSPCGACVSLRVPVATFERSRSQRRAANGCASLRCEIGPVRVDRERLALYAAWHSGRERERGWGPMPLGRKQYEEEFAFPHPCAREVVYYDDEAPDGRGPRLVGVGLCDELPGAWSAIYFFHDPAYAQRSLGVFHVLNLVARARDQGKAHVYLGYRIAECVSMQYKARFGPHELLEGRPADEEEPRWIAQTPADG
jgi:arginyl-tRNA--protein-N-Asp/Glu arginylyltransferase